MTAVMPTLPTAVALPLYNLDDQSAASNNPKSAGRTLKGDEEYAVQVYGDTKQPKHEQQTGDTITRRPSEKKYARGRSNSLRNVKNSKEMLRQRSANRGNKDVVLDGISGGREGRQFTVANVGNNGRIYLRPLVPGPQQKPPMPSFILPLATPPNSAGLDQNTQRTSTEQARASVWSDTQTSKTPTRKRAKSTSRGVQGSHISNRPRTQSLSTAEGPTANQAQAPGAFRVVIDHAKPIIQQSQDGLMPTLDVSIPHYRLGDPRFSARGTAFLHSSVYTGTSTNEELRVSAISGPEYERLFLPPTGTDHEQTPSQRHSHTSPQQFSIRIAPTGGITSSPVVTSTPVVNRPHEPITASIYDAIAVNPDDPAMVRYSPTTGEITAASPARIIAQITSKNFLDYELLSDFFLTVRSYLPTHDLQAYLLARFEWAINRFDDDGRVIRVRAFAALRHWILNYFPYDFVADRDLRVKFCQHLNLLSRLVRERSNGSSDMKLILDLKKCWNGRCAIYWDIPLSEDASRRDLDINPGGIAGSRDSSLTHPSQLKTTHSESISPRLDSSVDADKTASALNSWFDSVLEAGNTASPVYERQTSVATARSLPTSPTSEQSIPAMSCTIPSKGLKKLIAQPSQGLGVHPIPVPTTVKRVCPAAPSAMSNDPVSEKKHAHKRSGSFSDAFRDKRASLPSMQQPSDDSAVLTFPYSGSLVRGSILPPGSPYIDSFAPPSPTRELSSFVVPGTDDEDFDDIRTPSPLTPGMKHIFGSIRRALSSKQPSSFHEVTQGAGGIPASSTKTSKSSKNVPSPGEGNVQQLEALKKHTRIDLLCADVTEMFQRALQDMARQDTQPLNSIGVARLEREQPTLNKNRMETPGNGLQRGYSETTYGSRSIVIVDDTGVEPPLPAMPSQFIQASNINHTTNETRRVKSHGPSSPLTQHPTNNTLAGVQSDVMLGDILDTLPPVVQTSISGPRTRWSGNDRSGEHGPPPASLRQDFSRNSNGRSYVSTQSGSRSLRKYASYQSGGTRNNHEMTMTSEFTPDTTTSVTTAPQKRMLRRRPGGDLRANENVHDLEPITRSRSTGSITTYTDSVRGSELRMTRATRGTLERRSSNVLSSVHSGAAVSPVDKQLSLVRTCSSQPALRPSFEAAVAEFAQIPDDDRGDIEATLLKLEGKYRKRPVDTGVPSTGPHSAKDVSVTQSPTDEASSTNPQFQSKSMEAAEHQVQVPESVKLESLSADNSESRSRSRRHDMTTSLYAESEESYDSTPLLERGLSTKSKNKDRAIPDASADIPRPLFSPTLGVPNQESTPSLLSAEHSQARDSTRRTRYVSSIPTTTDSFLLDEDEFLSDLSSEISLDEEDEQAFHDEHYGSSAQLVQEGAQTPRPRYGSGSLPSPPMTSGNAYKGVPEANVFNRQHKPPTPEPSPVSRVDEPAGSGASSTPKLPTAEPLPTLKHNFLTRRHIPFIMSFDSKVLAEQFTIIEKDALNEINWLDLINMRWHHKSPSTQNWVDFLRTQDPTGIELVTARFNVIVKWALSEIVLTPSIEERALCIMKYIHIAQHCRKIHNYATLLQITLALTSVDCSRLSKTWELVPAAEKKALKDLETLITPIKNFHNLRQEMETTNSEEGCIPVVAMYIHDLTYNSQKPSQVASSREGVQLINFERYRTTASIVKSLLRLIDASAKYSFQPVDGALARCLWMASLSDEMIRVKSKELE